MPSTNTDHILRLSIDSIIPNPQQPRRHFNEQALQNLAKSIRSQGIIQPLIVRKSKNHPDHYELVAGERRWRALQLVDIQEVDVVLKEIEDDDLLEVALLENIQRENLTPIEEAICYRDLLELHGYTQEELARRIGKDRSTIANLIRLLQLPSAIQNDLEEGRLTIGHTRPLLALPTEKEQHHVREQILKSNWSVRQTEKKVKIILATYGENHKSKKKIKEIDSNELTLQLENLKMDLENHLGTKVSIQHHTNGKGSIKIDYYSLDDFDRLYQILTS